MLNKLYCPEINTMVQLTGTQIGKYSVAKILDSNRYCIIKTQEVFAIDMIVARYIDDYIGEE